MASTATQRIVPGAPPPPPLSKSQKKKRKGGAKHGDEHAATSAPQAEIPDAKAAALVEEAPVVNEGGVAEELVVAPEEVKEAISASASETKKLSPTMEILHKRLRNYSKKIVSIRFRHVPTL